MQPLKFEDIVDRVVSKKGITAENRELMKSIGLHTFSEAKKEMGLFKNISIIIPGLMIIFYGKKRLIDFQGRVESKLFPQEGVKPSKMNFLEGKDEGILSEVLSKVKNLLSIYEVYIIDKKTTKQAFREAKLKK